MPLSFLDTVVNQGPQRRRRRLRWLNVSLLTLSVAVLGLVIGAVYLTKSLNEMESATAERAWMNGRLRDLLSINIGLTDAETGQRGYLLTKRREYLAPYELAVKQLPALLEDLRKISAHDPMLHARVERLVPIIDAKLAELSRTIDLYDDGRHEQAVALVQSDEGLRHMALIRGDLAIAESELREKRDRADSRALLGSAATKLWALITVTALIASLGSAGYQLRSLARSRDSYERELARRTAFLNSVVDEIPSLVAVWDRNLTCRLVNKSFERWAARSRGDLIGKHLTEIADRNEYDRNLPWIRKALEGQSVRFEKEYTRGKLRHLSVSYTPLQNDDGEVIGIAALANDITDHQREKVRLQQLSETDPLTGLLNRLGFESFVKTQVAAGMSDSLAVLYLDLDEFKPVNDTFGHAAGDHVLQTIAERLKQTIRPSDCLARLGGDEFAVVLPDIRHSSDVQKVADKMLEEVRKPIPWEGHHLLVRACLGSAFNANAFGDWRALMAHADTMLYAAKRRRGPAAAS